MSDRRVACKLDPRAKPYPYNADQLAWLHDLETTTEAQTKNVLHSVGEDGKAGFCCLGRACVVLGLVGTRSKITGTHVLYHGLRDVAPSCVQKELRLRGQNALLAEQAHIQTANGVIQVGTLAAMNDRGMTFKQIAAYIRANPWNVFEAPEENNE